MVSGDGDDLPLSATTRISKSSEGNRSWGDCPDSFVAAKPDVLFWRLSTRHQTGRGRPGGDRRRAEPFVATVPCR